MTKGPKAKPKIRAKARDSVELLPNKEKIKNKTVIVINNFGH